MKPETIVASFWSQGFTIELAEDEKLLVSPSSKLQECHRDVLRANKPAIVAYLREADRKTAHIWNELIAAAMRRCDEHNDGQAAREQMRQDIAAVPVHQHADLLAHFRGERPDFSQGAA